MPKESESIMSGYKMIKNRNNLYYISPRFFSLIYTEKLRQNQYVLVWVNKRLLIENPDLLLQRWDLIPFSALINILFYRGLPRQITDLS